MEADLFYAELTGQRPPRPGRQEGPGRRWTGRVGGRGIPESIHAEDAGGRPLTTVDKILLGYDLRMRRTVRRSSGWVFVPATPERMVEDIVATFRGVARWIGLKVWRAGPRSQLATRFTRQTLIATGAARFPLQRSVSVSNLLVMWRRFYDAAFGLIVHDPRSALPALERLNRAYFEALDALKTAIPATEVRTAEDAKRRAQRRTGSYRAERKRADLRRRLGLNIASGWSEAELQDLEAAWGRLSTAERDLVRRAPFRTASDHAGSPCGVTSSTVSITMTPGCFGGQRHGVNTGVFTILHEMGHVIEFAQGLNADANLRARFVALYRRQPRIRSEFATPDFAEQFAEAFACFKTDPAFLTQGLRGFFTGNQHLRPSGARPAAPPTRTP